MRAREKMRNSLIFSCVTGNPSGFPWHINSGRRKNGTWFLHRDRLIPYYGFFIALGVVAAGAVGCLQVKLFRKDCNDFFILARMVGTGGYNRREASVSGGILEQIDVSSLTDPETLSGILNGGFVFYGGAAGGLLAAAACKKMAPGGYLGLRRGLHSLYPYRPCLWTVRLQRCGMLLRDAL